MRTEDLGIIKIEYSGDNIFNLADPANWYTHFSKIFESLGIEVVQSVINAPFHFNTEDINDNTRVNISYDTGDQRATIELKTINPDLDTQSIRDGRIGASKIIVDKLLEESSNILKNIAKE